jgi:sterol desaturase/sphingolipid hydroxylase (fatty acid hydroxylase superfamily)
MDWIVSFRFHWAEAVIYKAIQYLPLALLGFAGEALLFHAVLGTVVGHLNHANLDWGYGRWRYVLNSPRMHLWHHDADASRATNFGIIFSAWDWLFGTARLPDRPPRRLGFDGQDALPEGFARRSLWPLVGNDPSPSAAQNTAPACNDTRSPIDAAIVRASEVPSGAESQRRS